MNGPLPIIAFSITIKVAPADEAVISVPVMFLIPQAEAEVPVGGYRRSTVLPDSDAGLAPQPGRLTLTCRQDNRRTRRERTQRRQHAAP